MSSSTYLASTRFEITPEMARKRVDQINTVLKASMVAAMEIPLSRAFETLAEMAARIVPFDRCLIYLMDEETGHVSLPFSRGFAKGPPPSIQHGNLFSRWTFDHGQPIFVREAQDKEAALHLSLLEVSSLIALPIYRNTKVRGSVQFLKEKESGFTEDDLLLLGLLIRQFEPLLVKLLSSPPIEFPEVIDPATGLLVRSFFEDQIQNEFERIKRQRTSSLSLLKIEVDRFDAYLLEAGPVLGDRSLREIADRIKKESRQIDLLSHYGQGTFCAILPGTDKAGAYAASKRILGSLEGHPLLGADGRRDILLPVFIGLSTFPWDAKNPQDLIRTADLALYCAKSFPETRICPFSEIPSFTGHPPLKGGNGIDLDKLNEATNSIFNVDRLLNLILQISMESLMAERSSLMVRDPSSSGWILKVARGFDRESDAIETIRIEQPGEISSWVLKHKEPIVSEDLEGLPGIGQRNFVSYRGRSFLSFPLMEGDEVYGIIHLSERKDRSPFTKRDMDAFAPLALLLNAFIREGVYFEGVQKDFVQRAFVYLNEMMEFRNPYFQSHSKRVAHLAGSIGREIRLSSSEEECLRISSLCHDIGYLALDEGLRNKPIALTEEERLLSHQHPLLGSRILQTIPFLKEAGKVILSHHENFDGSGYPEGKAGEEIPLLSRILFVAEAYDAMTSSRPYRKALSREEALKELTAGAGRLFDPAILSTLERTLQ